MSKGSSEQHSRQFEMSNQESLELTSSLKMASDSEDEVISDVDSEEDYEPRFTVAKFSQMVTFLPFNPIWILIILFSVTIVYSITLYELVFLHSEGIHLSEWMIAVKVVCYVAYLIDTIAVILHMKNKYVAVLRNHKPRPIIQIIVDCFTLVPFEFVELFTSSSTIPQEVQSCMLLVACVRIYKVFVYFQDRSKSVGLNPWVNILCTFGVTLFILSHTLACVWYWHNGFKDAAWVVGSNLVKASDSPFQWYLTCLYYTISVMTATGFGDIYSHTMSEHILSLLAMLLGFTLITGLFIGTLTNAIVQSYTRHSVFWRKLCLIQLDLSTRQMFNNAMIEKVINFYKKFWMEKGAIKNSIILKTLPTQMVCEVRIEMYWNAINSCPLFRSLDISYKREISKYMTSECFMEGDVILQQGKLKCKMIYVVQGVIQILSREDSESPLMALAAGSCLGEMSLLLSYPSVVEINAATYCELQMLDKRRLLQLIRAHPQIGRKIYDNHRGKLRTSLAMVEEKRQEIERLRSREHKRALKDLKVTLRKREEVQSQTPPFIWLHEVEHEELMSEDGKKALKSTEKVITLVALDKYRLSKSVELETDDVCLRTRWPWVFNPNSNVLSIWNWMIVFTISFACFFIPYFVCFKRQYIPRVEVYFFIIDIFYWFDLYLQLTTAVMEDGDYVTSIFQIMLRTGKRMRFIIDVVASLPVESLAHSIWTFSDPLEYHIFRLNRLLKIHRVLKLFDELQNGRYWDNTVVRMCKYIFFLLLGSFWMGSVFYMQACLIDSTCANSWVQKFGNRHNQPSLTSFYFAAVVISGTGYGDIFAANDQEMVIMIFFYIVGVLLFGYLISDYSGMLILKDTPRLQFSERVFAISRFLEVNKLDKAIRERVSNFLQLQWRYRLGYSIMNDDTIFSDAPQGMQEWVTIWRRKTYFQGMDLFKGTDEKLIEKLCLMAESHTLPPNEIVTFAGEVCRDFYILQEGFCESTSNLWEDVGVIGPYTSFNESEMVFGIPGFYNVRTITHCRLLRVSLKSFKTILNQFPEFNEALKKVTDEHILDERLIPSIRHNRFVPVTHASLAPKDPSWVKHKPSTKQHPNPDYDKPFHNLSIFAFIRYILLRRTIYPSGKFLICWEVARCSFAVMSSLLFPPMSIFRTEYNFLFYCGLFLDFTAYVDLYVRTHVCYYNRQGILISHPWYTCKHYLSHGFGLDLLACMPLEKILGSDGSYIGWKNIISQNFVQLNRTLQLHRITSLFSYWEEDILREHRLLKLIKYVPFGLATLNILTCVYIWLHSSYALVKGSTSFQFQPYEETWLEKFYSATDNFTFDLKHPVNVYIIVCYWVSATMFGIGFGDIVPERMSEMVYCIIIILFGYVVFTYITVRIASMHASYNRNLTLYQEQMSHLMKFSKREKISRYLRREIKEHFENVWQKTRGLKPYKMFEKFHLQLKEDTAMFLYEETLSSNTLFRGVEKSFFRRLVVLVRERYFVAGAQVVILHDFVTNMLFVHQGELSVYDLSDERRGVLTRGHLFGHLERHRDNRLVMSVVATTNVLLLVISTEQFYRLVDDYPIVRSRLCNKGYEEIMQYNFVESRRNSLSKSDILGSPVSQSTLMKRLVTFFPTIYLTLMIFSYLSCFLVTYHLAFESQAPYLWVLIISFTLDFFVILRIPLGFYSPYKDNMGDLVIEPRLIKQNYLRDKFGFALDVTSSFPLEIFALAASTGDRYFALAWLRIIHLLRAFHIVKFFNIRFERLDVNVLLYKTSHLALWIILLFHTLACIFYMISCPRQVCNPGSWAVQLDNLCHKSFYICSLYFTVEVITAAGMGNVKPFSQVELVYATILSILSKFATAIFIGSMSAIVANYSYTLVNYDYETNIFKDYLRGNPICGPLVRKVLRYVMMMWKSEKGGQVPTMLTKMPPYLLARFNTEAYGRHLYENYIFSTCEGDFLRQLIVYLRRYTFYPGNFVVQQGDMDNSLYFIHTGEVEVIAIGERSMELIDVLMDGDTFGLNQGLHMNRPHDYTYRASAVSVILTLKYDDWEHLLNYYPGTRNDILYRVRQVVAPVQRII